MKKLTFAVLILLALLLITICRATPTSLTPLNLTNTTNTVAGVQAFTYNAPLQNAVIAHGPVGMQPTGIVTNALYVNIYASAPNSTTTNGRVLIGVWYPQTNAMTETILGSNYPVTNFLSFDVCVSNTVTGLSGSYGN